MPLSYVAPLGEEGLLNTRGRKCNLEISTVVRSAWRGAASKRGCCENDATFAGENVLLGARASSPKVLFKHGRDMASDELLAPTPPTDGTMLR